MGIRRKRIFFCMWIKAYIDKQKNAQKPTEFMQTEENFQTAEFEGSQFKVNSEVYMTKNSMTLDPNMVANFQTINQRKSVGLEEEISINQSP